MLHQAAPVADSPLSSETTAATWFSDASDSTSATTATTTNTNTIRYIRMSQLDIRILIITASFLILLLTILFINCIIRILFRRLLHTTSFYYNNNNNNSKVDGAPAGMTRAQIQALPMATFVNPEVATLAAATSDPAQTCAICLQGFRHLDRFRVLPGCHHSFHVACIDTWLAKHSSCPTCRRHLTPGQCVATPRCLYLHFVIPVITNTRHHTSDTQIPPHINSNSDANTNALDQQV